MTTNYQFVDPKLALRLLKINIIPVQLSQNLFIRLTEILQYSDEIFRQKLCAYDMSFCKLQWINTWNYYLSFTFYTSSYAFHEVLWIVIFQQIDKEETLKGFRIAVNCKRIISLKFFATKTIPRTLQKVCYLESIHIHGVLLHFIGRASLFFRYNMENKLWKLLLIEGGIIVVYLALQRHVWSLIFTGKWSSINNISRRKIIPLRMAIILAQFEIYFLLNFWYFYLFECIQNFFSVLFLKYRPPSCRYIFNTETSVKACLWIFVGDGCWGKHMYVSDVI